MIAVPSSSSRTIIQSTSTTLSSLSSLKSLTMTSDSRRRYYNTYSQKYKSSTPRWEKRLQQHLEKFKQPAPPLLPETEVFKFLGRGDTNGNSTSSSNQQDSDSQNSFPKTYQDYEREVKYKSSPSSCVQPHPSTFSHENLEFARGCFGATAIGSSSTDPNPSNDNIPTNPLANSKCSLRVLDSSRTQTKSINPCLGSVRTGLIAYKVGMMSLYDAWGRRHGVTIAHCDRVRVVGKRTIQTHGYSAVQLGMGYKPLKRQRKQEIGQFMKAGVGPKEMLHEFRVSPDCTLPVGHKMSVRHFVPGQWCFVSGKTRPRGWLGVMQRWNFAGLPAADGVSKAHRSYGSVGIEAVGRVYKGKKMAGHSGPDPRVVNCKVFRIDAARDLIFLVGQVPGPRGSLIKIHDGRGRTNLKNAHIRRPYPTFVPQEEVKYPTEVTEPPMLRDPFCFPDVPIYQPDD